MKTLGCEGPKGAELPSPIGSQKAVGVVLDNTSTGVLGDIKNDVHLACDTGVMNRNNYSRSLRHEGFETSLVKIERVLTNVGKNQPSSTKGKSIRGRHKRERREDDLVTWTDVE